MIPLKIIMVAGLLLSTLGTIVIWIDSQAFIRRIMHFLLEVISTIGFNKDSEVNQDQKQILQKSMQQSVAMNMRGFLLLLIGFILQIVSLVA